MASYVNVLLLLIIIPAIPARRMFDKVYLYLQIKDSFLPLKFKKYHGTSPVQDLSNILLSIKNRRVNITNIQQLFTAGKGVFFSIYDLSPLFMTNSWNLTFDIQISLTSNLTSPTHDRMVTTPWDRTEGSRLEMSLGIQYLPLPSLHGWSFPIQLWIQSKTAPYKI